MKKLLNIICAIIFILFLSVESLWAGTVTTSGVMAHTLMGEIRAELHEATASFWNDSDFYQYMDEAVFEIQSRTGAMESGQTSFPVTVGQFANDMADNFLTIETILYDSGKTNVADDSKIYALKRVSIKEIGHKREKGNPKEFTVWNNQILIWPVPITTRDGDSGTSILYVYATTLPSGITTSTSHIRTPSYFTPAIKNYVKAKAYYKDNRLSVGNHFMNLFNLKLQEYMVTVIRRDVPVVQ